MSVKFQLKGDREMARRIRAEALASPRKAERALWRFGNRVMTRSKDEFVPVDLGTLRKSGRVHPPTWSGSATVPVLTVVLSYGDDASPYALAVHEHLSSHSPPSWKAAERAGNPVQFSPAGHGPKYLERPLNEESGNMLPYLAQEMRL